MSAEAITHIELETITACNHRCAYCPNSRFERGSRKNLRKMDEELFFKIIDELAEIPTVASFSPHFYGEPLLDDRLPALLRYVRLKIPAICIVLYTNGDFLTLERYRELIESGVNRFVVSEHGQEMMLRVGRILKYREETGDNSVQLEIQRFRKGREILTRGGLIGARDTDGFVKMIPCNVPSHVVVIDYRGKVVLCCNDYLTSATFGNLRERSLLDIWKDGPYAEIRRELRSGIFRLPICKDCGTIPMPF